MFRYAALATVLLYATANAAEMPMHHGNHPSPYAGQEARAVKSLSDQDIDDLLNGRGWGFAKAAELNGMPGPVHVLEMADAVALDSGQRAAIESLYEAMRADTVPLGRQLVDQEKLLEKGFAERTVTTKA